jgi:hypothetical protein
VVEQVSAEKAAGYMRTVELFQFVNDVIQRPKKHTMVGNTLDQDIRDKVGAIVLAITPALGEPRRQTEKLHEVGKVYTLVKSFLETALYTLARLNQLEQHS